LSLNHRADQFVPKYRPAHGIEMLALTEETVLHLDRFPSCIATRSTEC
jgi:hypothetical protein